MAFLTGCTQARLDTAHDSIASLAVERESFVQAVVQVWRKRIPEQLPRSKIPRAHGRFRYSEALSCFLHGQLLERAHHEYGAERCRQIVDAPLEKPPLFISYQRPLRGVSCAAFHMRRIQVRLQIDDVVGRNHLGTALVFSQAFQRMIIRDRESDVLHRLYRDAALDERISSCVPAPAARTRLRAAAGAAEVSAGHEKHRAGGPGQRRRVWRYGVNLWASSSARWMRASFSMERSPLGVRWISTRRRSVSLGRRLTNPSFSQRDTSATVP